MAPFLLGFLALVIILSWTRKYMAPEASRIAGAGEKLVSAVVLAMALYYLFKGSVFLGLVLGSIALSRVGTQAFWWMFLPDLPRPKFRTRYLDMQVDVKKGIFTGSVRSGSYAGRALDSFSKDELIALFSAFADDRESCELLAAYLDRRHPLWRENAHANAGAGQAGSGASHTLSEEEAYEILGLQKGASVEEISEAYRRLMKGLHPDAGGSAWIATRINSARDRLVKTHYSTPQRKTGYT